MLSFVDMLKSFDDFYTSGGVGDEDIIEAEERLSLAFSPEFKDYLKECGVASANGHEFTGIVNSKRLSVVNATEYEREKNSNLPNNLYVVENLQIDGITIWQNESGQLFKTVYHGNPEKICDSLVEYLQEEVDV